MDVFVVEVEEISDSEVRSKKRRRTNTEVVEDTPSRLPPKKRGKKKKPQEESSASINLNEIFCGEGLSHCPVNLAPVDMPESPENLEEVICEGFVGEQDDQCAEDIYYYLAFLKFKFIPSIQSSQEDCDRLSILY